MQNEISRREFLGRSAVAGGAWWAVARPASVSGVASVTAEGWVLPASTKIHVVYAGRTGDAYLTRPTEELARFEEKFKEIEQNLGNVRFVGSDEIPPAKVEELAVSLRTMNTGMEGLIMPAIGPTAP